MAQSPSNRAFVYALGNGIELDLQIRQCWYRHGFCLLAVRCRGRELAGVKRRARREVHKGHLNISAVAVRGDEAGRHVNVEFAVGDGFRCGCAPSWRAVPATVIT